MKLFDTPFHALLKTAYAFLYQEGVCLSQKKAFYKCISDREEEESL